MEIQTGSQRSVIVGGRGTLAELEEWAGQAARAGRRVFVFTDTNVMSACGEDVLRALSAVTANIGPKVLPAGEGIKSVAGAAACWEWLAERGARRDDVVAALGGGVVGDLAGFVAATYLRGLRLWQIPTTLLAQVDSSVGGKVAVNLPHGKNLIGSFYQPELVVQDISLLRTLPDEEYVNGLGEVVKYGLLDGPLFGELEAEGELLRRRDETALGRVIQKCVAFKAEVVQSDETDKGRRAILNLGHTTAHALEASVGYGGLSHGKAVGMGLLVALVLSEELLGLSPDLRTRVVELMQRLDLPVSLASERGAARPTAIALLEAAAHDKKRTAGTTGFVLLEDLGAPVWGVDVPIDSFLRAMEIL